MKRLPAFTLLESIISLLLFGIVGTMAVSVLQYLRQGMGTGVEHQIDEELIWLLSAFNVDRERSERMWVASSGEILLFCDGDTVRYGLVDDTVVRTGAAGSKNVFKVHALALETRPATSMNIYSWTLVMDRERTPKVRFVDVPSIAEIHNAGPAHATP